MATAILRIEFRPRAHPFAWAVELLTRIPSGALAVAGTDRAKLPITRRRRRWRSHFISATAEVLTVSALRRKTVVIHHPTMMPAHSVGALRHLKIVGTSALFHLRRTHVHSRPSALRTESRPLLATALPRPRSLATFIVHLRWRETFTLRIAIRACLLKRRTILPVGAVFASLVRLAIGAVHLPAIAVKAALAKSAIAVLRTGFAVAWSFGAIGVRRTGSGLPLRWVWLRWLRNVFLGAERPRGKREHDCGDEYRSLFHAGIWFHRDNAAGRGFCAGRFVNAPGRS